MIMFRSRITISNLYVSKLEGTFTVVVRMGNNVYINCNKEAELNPHILKKSNSPKLHGSVGKWDQFNRVLLSSQFYGYK